MSKIPGVLLVPTRNGVPEAQPAMLLTDDEITAITRDAFRPLGCVVEILPDQQLRFQVLKQKKPTPVYTEPGIPIEVLRDVDGLRELLRSVRRLVEERGYQLNPWPLPR